MHCDPPVEFRDVGHHRPQVSKTASENAEDLFPSPKISSEAVAGKLPLAADRLWPFSAKRSVSSLQHLDQLVALANASHGADREAATLKNPT
jgi:hypothetical protein